MLNEINLLSVRQRIVYNTLKLIYKAEYKLIPIYLCELFNYVSEVQPYNLRSNENFRLPNNMTSFAQNSVLYKGVKLYNEMKSECEINGNLTKFKETLIQYVKRF